MAPAKLIVFGPTGDIGSTAALTARQLGADVVLAMRDPSKTIRGLTPELERQGGFERVQADLSDPESVAAAVKQTGAKHAFIYILLQNQDGLRPSIEALKSAGIEFVVLISSISVHSSPLPVKELAADKEDFIGSAHARVEVSLGEVFGPERYVALRPAYFASNSHRWLGRGQLKSGRVTIELPGQQWDWIAPQDIGRVAAHVVVRGPEVVREAGSEAIFLTGPKLISAREGTEIIAKAVGLDKIEVKEILDVDEAVRHMIEAQGVPKPIALALAKYSGSDTISTERVKIGAENVRKFGDGKNTSLEEWAKAHKDFFD